MNDKQKDILLNAIGYHLTLQYKSPSPELRPDYERRIRELLAAFDAAADAPRTRPRGTPCMCAPRCLRESGGKTARTILKPSTAHGPKEARDE